MFEEINQHRAAVAENIQKACEIGFTGDELEKAHKVGDIHQNGKWVWTQLPSGRYDWRVIKKTGGGSASSVPSTAQKQAISISANHPTLQQVPGVNNVKEYLTTFNSKYTDLSKVTLSRTPKGNWDVRYDGHRLGILNGNQIPESSVKKMGWMEKTEVKKPKISSFVKKTIDEIKKTVGWRNYTDEKIASIAKKVQENEELAKKIMGGKFPTASWSSLNPNEESVAIGNDELIFSAYKNVHSSRYAAHNGTADYHYSVKIRYYGNIGAKEIARGSYSSTGWGGTAAEAKKECKIDALLNLIGE